jgi:hypothetical protein
VYGMRIQQGGVRGPKGPRTNVIFERTRFFLTTPSAARQTGSHADGVPTPRSCHRRQFSAHVGQGANLAESHSTHRFDHIAVRVSRLLTDSPPLLANGANHSKGRGSHVSSRRRCNAPLRSVVMPTLLTSWWFQRPEIPKRLAYRTSNIHTHGQTRKVMAHCNSPECTVNRRSYRLELSSDLGSLRLPVPGFPDFSSTP